MKNLNLCLFLLTIFMSISCSRDEEPDTKSVTNLNTAQTYIINGGIEYVSEKNGGSQISSKPKFIYDIPKINNSTNHVNNITSKTAEESISIDFGFPGYPLGNPTNSGCTMSWYNHSSCTSTTSDKGVYGSNPALSTYNPNDKPYLVRGFSLPHQNYYYGSLVLHVSNKGKKNALSEVKLI